MYPISTLWSEESNQGQRVRRLAVFVGWQLWKRIIRKPIAVSLFNGKRFKAYPDCHVSSGVLYTRIPNSRNILFLRKHLSGGTLIDVGSNVGSVTLLLADIIQDAILFEPNPLAAARARENLARNQLDFKVYGFALSDVNGGIRFESHGAVDVGGHVRVRPPRGERTNRLCACVTFGVLWPHSRVDHTPCVCCTPVFNVVARAAGVDLHVIFLGETDETLRQWRVYKNEICFSHQILPSWRWRAGRGNFLINRGLWSALNNANPQVIICGGYNYAASWEALLWARRQRVPFLLWSGSNSHDARAGRAWVEILKAYFLRHCDRFVVPGKASLEYLKMLGRAEASILTAPNAADNGLFATQAESTLRHATEFRDRLKLPSRFILFVGRLVPEKGVFDLLEAYAKLESGVRLEVGLVFAGDGESRQELAQRAKRISPGVVCFPGFAQREDLAGIYALAECLALPTHSDP